MKFISNASNPGSIVNLEAIENVIKMDKAIRFLSPGKRVTWTFSTNAKRDAAYTAIITNMAITDIAEV